MGTKTTFPNAAEAALVSVIEPTEDGPALRTVTTYTVAPPGTAEATPSDTLTDRSAQLPAQMVAACAEPAATDPAKTASRPTSDLRNARRPTTHPTPLTTTPSSPSLGLG